MKRSQSVIILIMFICPDKVYTWTPSIFKSDVSFEEATRFCNEKSMGLPGVLTNEERVSLTSYMKDGNINYTWLSLTRKFFPTFQSVKKDFKGQVPSVRRTGQKPSFCLVLVFKESGKQEVKAIECYHTLPAICEIKLCEWCPYWNCRRTRDGCVKLIRGAPSWFNARAECVKLGGNLWVNSSYSINDINWPDLKESVKQDVWLGWRKEDWSYPEDFDNIRPPKEFYLREPPINTNCVLQTIDPFRWTSELCNTAAAAVCWRRGILSEITTTGISATTSAVNETKERIKKKCTKITTYRLIFSVVAAVCVIISVLSVACCIRLAMRVRKHNLMRYNKEDKVSFRKEDNGKGIIASIRRSARGLSQIYTEIFDIQGRTLPRTPSEQHYGVSRTPIKESTSENENQSAQKPRSEIGVYLKQDPIDGLQYSAPATGSFKKGSASQVQGPPAYAKCKPKYRGDVSVYVKQKQTVGLCHDRPPSNFLPVLTESMIVEENPAYESSLA